MKKSILLGIAGVALAGVSSYGQGFIQLDNYSNSAQGSGNTPVYGAGVPANGVSGGLGTVGVGLNSSWTEGLYFVVGTPSITDPVGNGIPNGALALGTGGGSTIQIANGSVNNTAGAFASVALFNVSASGTPTITLELVAYDTADGSYANAAFRGHSAPFTLASQAGNATSPTTIPTGFGALTVTPVPEPTTLALAGLGGFGMLMALRRKQA